MQLDQMIYLKELKPYLMMYDEKWGPWGDNAAPGDQERIDKKTSLMRGYHLGKQTYVHNMDTFLWASNSYTSHLHET